MQEQRSLCPSSRNFKRDSESHENSLLSGNGRGSSFFFLATGPGNHLKLLWYCTEMTEKCRGVGEEVPEEDVVPQILLSFPDTYGPPINASESRQFNGELFEEQARMNECKQTEKCSPPKAFSFSCGQPGQMKSNCPKADSKQKAFCWLQCFIKK